MAENEFPRALVAPQAACVSIGGDFVRHAVEQSRKSPRGRIIQPLHKSADAPLQRMLNAIQPGSYIRPHRHAENRPESIVVVSGAILFLAFSENGQVEQVFALRAGTETFGVDFEGRVWHSFLALEPDTVVFEVKAGPYDPATDKEFAAWAPEEGSANAAEFLRHMASRHLA